MSCSLESTLHGETRCLQVVPNRIYPPQWGTATGFFVPFVLIDSSSAWNKADSGPSRTTWPNHSSLRRRHVALTGDCFGSVYKLLLVNKLQINSILRLENPSAFRVLRRESGMKPRTPTSTERETNCHPFARY